MLWFCDVLTLMIHFDLKSHLITLWGKRGKLKTYRAFRAFISSFKYTMFALPSSCLFISFPILSSTPQKLSCMICCTVFCPAYPHRKLQPAFHTGPKMHMHTTGPLWVWKFQERARVQWNVVRVQGDAVTGASSPIVVGLFCSPYFLVLLFPSWAFPLKQKKKRAIKHVEPYHCHIMLMSLFHTGKCSPCFRYQMHAHPAGSVASTSQRTQLDTEHCNQHQGSHLTFPSCHIRIFVTLFPV